MVVAGNHFQRTASEADRITWQGAAVHPHGPGLVVRNREGAVPKLTPHAVAPATDGAIFDQHACMPSPDGHGPRLERSVRRRIGRQEVLGVGDAHKTPGRCVVPVVLKGDPGAVFPVAGAGHQARFGPGLGTVVAALVSGFQ